LQQLRKALVSREEAKRVEEMLKQVPAKRLTMKHWRTHASHAPVFPGRLQSVVLRSPSTFPYAPRFARCRAPSACMERVNL